MFWLNREMAQRVIGFIVGTSLVQNKFNQPM